MATLRQDQQEAARKFVAESARPFEKQLYAHYFEGTTVEAPLRELSTYQNPDGGFGNALEPDIRAKCSSPYVTGEALRALRELEVPGSHPIVKHAVNYLLESYDQKKGVWVIAPPEANDAPHSPWMGYGDNVERQWHGFLANPKAAIVASLLHYASIVPDEWLSDVLNSLCSYLLDRSGDLDGYESGAVGQLLDTEALPGGMRDQLSVVAKGKLSVPARPESPIIGLFSDEEIDGDLDALIASQSPDGTWPIEWSWGGPESEIWATAEREWKGILIVAHMKKLAAFGRLE